MLKALFNSLLAVSISSASLLAGSVTELTTTESNPTEEEGLSFGAPHLEFFTRSQSTTSKLPGYFIGSLAYQKQFAADFDSLAGDIKSDEFSLFGPVLALNYNEWHLLAFFYYTQTKFETSSASSLIPDSTLHSFNLPIAILKEHGHNWISGAFVMPSWNGDSDASDTDGIAAGAGVGYVFNPDFRFLLGAYYSHYYGTDTFIPAIQLIYRPCTDVELYILGPIGGVSYSINDDWFVGTSLRFSSPTWKVQADNAGPERTVKVSRINLAMRSEHRLYKNIWGAVDFGYSFGRELEIQDIDNNVLQKSAISAGPFASIGINYRY